MDGPRSSAGSRLAIARRAVEKFLDVTPAQFADVERAAADGDAAALAEAVHRLSESALTFRDRGVSRVCGEIEELARAGDWDAAAARVTELRNDLDRLSSRLREWLASL